MNKYQEALDRISTNFGECEIGSRYYDLELDKDIATLQELVDKSSLKHCNYKEVEYGGVGYTKPFCPSCNKQLSYYGKPIRFCENCGQKIKVEE